VPEVTAVTTPDGKTHWSCGCVTWVQDHMFMVKACSPNCVVVTTALRASAERNNRIIVARTDVLTAAGFTLEHVREDDN